MATKKFEEVQAKWEQDIKKMVTLRTGDTKKAYEMLSTPEFELYKVNDLYYMFEAMLRADDISPRVIAKALAQVLLSLHTEIRSEVLEHVKGGLDELSEKLKKVDADNTLTSDERIEKAKELLATAGFGDDTTGKETKDGISLGGGVYAVKLDGEFAQFIMGLKRRNVGAANAAAIVVTDEEVAEFTRMLTEKAKQSGYNVLAKMVATVDTAADMLRRFVFGK